VNIESMLPYKICTSFCL